MKINHAPLLLIVLSSSVVLAAQTTMEVIPLLNRSASDIQPLLSPLLEYTDWVGADGANLVVKTSPERLAQIKALIEKLDTPQHNLIITVILSKHMTADRTNAKVRRQPDNSGHKQPASGINSDSHYYQTQDSNGLESTQTIRTLEGNTAYIRTGHTYPVENLRLSTGAYGYPAISTSTSYVAASTGFAVTPRLTGSEVILDITPWSDNMNTRGQINTQGAQAKLKAKLGEWVELGASNGHSAANASSRPAHIWQTDEDSLHILVKVDKAN
ncbi:MAG: hypothetical protein Q7U57_10245 [Methylovulum sp.]|nr:hypothetical protein [Methylovulum sp.]